MNKTILALFVSGVLGQNESKAVVDSYKNTFETTARDCKLGCDIMQGKETICGTAKIGSDWSLESCQYKDRCNKRTLIPNTTSYVEIECSSMKILATAAAALAAVAYTV